MRLVWADINLDAIRHNIREVRRILDPQVKIMSIIKANGYGHGAPLVASQALDEDSDYFGVAVLSEAMALRQKWITKPVLLLGYTDWRDYDLLMQFDIMQTLFNLDQARQLNEAAQKAGKCIKVHIKLDTGMHRTGFSCQPASLKEVAQIYQMDHLQVEGIFSHMANADQGDEAYNDVQLKAFSAFSEDLEKLRILEDKRARQTEGEKGLQGPSKIPLKHLANSATLLSAPQAHLDMVRPGIILYGHYPSAYIEEAYQDKLKLRPAMNLKARIVHLMRAKAGMPISYGGTHQTREGDLIATLPLGYADGYPRALSNRGRVLIKGKLAPIVGRICMDQMMVDVTGIEGVSLGDEVTLFGVEKESGAHLPVKELAQMTQTINYEILTSISERVPRVMVHD